MNAKTWHIFTTHITAPTTTPAKAGAQLERQL
ncbi:hypothetical protein C8J45_10969 [Sphingomonas sp. PP-CE-3G-477]|nr:hypothetical protein C8J45_10969 [Sphingomonas sp. PP-CE-3G-477]